jgi:hypothetical protein
MVGYIHSTCQIEILFSVAMGKYMASMIGRNCCISVKEGFLFREAQRIFVVVSTLFVECVHVYLLQQIKTRLAGGVEFHAPVVHVTRDM